MSEEESVSKKTLKSTDKSVVTNLKKDSEALKEEMEVVDLSDDGVEPIRNDEKRKDTLRKFDPIPEYELRDY